MNLSILTSEQLLPALVPKGSDLATKELEGIQVSSVPYWGA